MSLSWTAPSHPKDQEHCSNLQRMHLEHLPFHRDCGTAAALDGDDVVVDDDAVVVVVVVVMVVKKVVGVAAASNVYRLHEFD